MSEPVKRSRRARLIAAAGAVAAVAMIGAGCGERQEGGGSEREQLRIALDFFPNPDHIGYYQALAADYFTEAGLEVETFAGSDPSQPLRQLAGGEVDLAISYEPEVILARDRGLDVVAVAAIAHRPLTSLMSLGAGGVDLTDLRSLRGRTIATAGIPYQDAYLEAILGDVGLEPDDVEVVNVMSALSQALLSKRADAVLGAFWNVEGVTLRRARGSDLQVEVMDELGIPTYDELVLVARRSSVEEDPEPLRLFIAALARGTEDALADPALGTRALLDADNALEASSELVRAQVTATLPALRGERQRPFGFMSTAAWEEFAGFMADQGLAKRRYGAEDLLTNELLPGEIPK